MSARKPAYWLGPELRKLEDEAREERERPIREAEAKLREASTAIERTIRDRISTGIDDAFQIDPATFTPLPRGISAAQYNKAQAQQFRQSNPDFYPSDFNLREITEYIARNTPTNFILVSATQLQWAFERLRAYGLLEERPEPEPEPEIVPEPANPSEPEIFVGIDQETGEERTFSKFQVDRMSAEEYRRTFPTAKTVKDLFNAMRVQRDQQ